MDFDLLDIQFLGFFIILNRFIYFLFNYNLITSLYIVFISTGSCILWFNFLVLNLKFFFKLEKNVGRTLKTQYLNIIDNKMDRFIKSIVKIFYKKKKKLRFLNTLWEDIRTLLIYLIFIRGGREYLPFFIRWNWSLVIFLKFLSKATCVLYRRAYYYKFKVLKYRKFICEDYQENPEAYPSYTEDTIRNFSSKLEAEDLYTNATIFVLIFLNLFISFYGFINSALGQFTIFPFTKTLLGSATLPKNILCEKNKTILKLLKIENI
uniref:Ycf90 n=1 Tax=Nitzschia sp. IriIs04 TaxID=1444690 RepID=A0A0S3QPI3_9STRA|nr:Ycf90 [Nitzschia sp. IriIs04]BAT70254.1 Ycf90 [Nitzschia sp. IriIs04]